MNGPLRGSGSPSSLKIAASVPKTGAEREGATQKSAWRSGFTGGKALSFPLGLRFEKEVREGR